MNLDSEPDVLAGVLHALEPLAAEAAGVREGVGVLHLVLPVRRTGAESEEEKKQEGNPLMYLRRFGAFDFSWQILLNLPNLRSLRRLSQWP